MLIKINLHAFTYTYINIHLTQSYILPLVKNAKGAVFSMGIWWLPDIGEDNKHKF